MSTQVQLFDTRLTLLSIPLEQYTLFAQGVATLVLGLWKDDIKAQGIKAGLSESDIDDKCDKIEEFYNVSFTPVECSIMCATELVDKLFGRALAIAPGAERITDEYVAIKVDSDGQDTGERVLEISAPMTKASISIFFITTYFSDYVLVPAASRDRVIRALEALDFVFSDIANSYVSLPETSSSASEKEHVPPFGTYSPSLNKQTFAMFEEQGVRPLVDPETKLLLTGARSGARHEPDALLLAIVRVLLRPPQYFSLTVSGVTELSFLIDAETAKSFPDNALLGSPTEYVLPVSFDLRGLPQDSVGIVAGVASRLLEGSDHKFNMSYLSTAKTGVVLVIEDDLEFTLKAFSRK